MAAKYTGDVLCMYVCMYACIYVCMCMHVCTCMCACMYVCISTCVYVCAYTWGCVCVLCMHMCVCTCTCVCTADFRSLSQSLSVLLFEAGSHNTELTISAWLNDLPESTYLCFHSSGIADICHRAWLSVCVLGHKRRLSTLGSKHCSLIHLPQPECRNFLSFSLNLLWLWHCYRNCLKVNVLWGRRLCCHATNVKAKARIARSIRIKNRLSLSQKISKKFSHNLKRNLFSNTHRYHKCNSAQSPKGSGVQGRGACWGLALERCL